MNTQYLRKMGKLRSPQQIDFSIDTDRILSRAVPYECCAGDRTSNVKCLKAVFVK
ncbi:hypothetical protein QUA40_03155 [Microcoleus sp. Pol11C3]|uniref:hypothetical protein n=1 Tax=Microcoleus sp. Pol11C3 TaxID=3055390 RepID=UPI002FD14C20